MNSEDFNKKSIHEKVQHFTELFEMISKEESDYISNILKWNNETMVAFKLAKKLFEEED